VEEVERAAERESKEAYRRAQALTCYTGLAKREARQWAAQIKQEGLKFDQIVRDPLNNYEPKVDASGQLRIRHQTPTVVAVAVDITTGMAYRGVSAHVPPAGGYLPQTQALLNRCAPTMEERALEQCAEVQALDNAFRGGAQIKNLEFHAVNVDSQLDMPLCFNCQRLVSRAYGATSGIKVDR
jgi:hypothetical protein